MNICLVTAPTVTEFDRRSDFDSVSVLATVFYPHLGVLSLAGMLAREGGSVQVLNLNRLYHSYVLSQSRATSKYLESRGERGDFEKHAIKTMLSFGSAIYGFSSICSTYPLTIRLAQGIKQANPDCTIIFGGPQASVVDRETLAAFSFVDFVLRGEAERTLPMLLCELASTRRFSSVPGLTHRSPFGITRNGTPPVIENLDDLPLPDFGLEGGFVSLPRAPLEAGRGCPFDCTFCSTNDFFRRKFRMKSPERMLEDMRAIASRWGSRSFELTHDMYTVDRKRVVAFCETMLATDEGFRWACSARTDFVDEALIALMARAGCDGLFFGIESGSVRIQRAMRKNLDPDRAKEVIASADKHGIRSTVSLIVGFPEETWQDIEDSIAMFVFALSLEKAGPQIAILAPLAETPIHSQYKDALILDDLCSDMSHQSRTLAEADRRLIRQYPQIFPNFYLLPTPDLDQATLIELHEFLATASDGLRWLLVALDRTSPGLLEAFFRWREYRLRIHPDLRSTALRQYYVSRESRDEFVQFVAGLQTEFDAPAVRGLLQIHEKSAHATSITKSKPLPDGTLRTRQRGAWNPDDILSRRSGIHVIDADWNLQNIIESLRNGTDPIGAQTKTFYLRHPISKDIIRLAAITPLAAAALDLCDGRTELSAVLLSLSPHLATFPARLKPYAGLELLKGLHRKGYLEVHRNSLTMRAKRN